MGVEAVVGDVGLAADEPLGERLVPLEHLVEGLKPVQLAGQPAPEALDVVGRLLPQLLVGGQRADLRPLGEFRRRRKDAASPASRFELPAARSSA